MNYQEIVASFKACQKEFSMFVRAYGETEHKIALGSQIQSNGNEVGVGVLLGVKSNSETSCFMIYDPMMQLLTDNEKNWVRTNFKIHEGSSPVYYERELNKLGLAEYTIAVGLAARLAAIQQSTQTPAQR